MQNLHLQQHYCVKFGTVAILCKLLRLNNSHIRADYLFVCAELHSLMLQRHSQRQLSHLVTQAQMSLLPDWIQHAKTC